MLGVVLNRSASQGFYAREKILAPVHAYFAKTRLGLYGIIPDEPSLTNLRNEAASSDIDTAPIATHVCGSTSILSNLCQTRRATLELS